MICIPDTVNQLHIYKGKQTTDVNKIMSKFSFVLYLSVGKYENVA